MSPLEQRIAIATACGWRIDPTEPVSKPGSALYIEPEKALSVFGVPDYLNDLNAMHEAEKVLVGNQPWEYQRLLCNRNGPLCMADAAQRAEAFLRTLDLWRDDAG